MHGIDCSIHCVANVYALLPVSTVKCLCSGGRNEGGKKATPTSISILDFYDIKICELNLMIISSPASKCQHFKIRGLQFHLVKWLKIGHFNFKMLAF